MGIQGEGSVSAMSLDLAEVSSVSNCLFFLFFFIWLRSRAPRAGINVGVV